MIAALTHTRMQYCKLLLIRQHARVVNGLDLNFQIQSSNGFGRVGSIPTVVVFLHTYSSRLLVCTSGRSHCPTFFCSWIPLPSTVRWLSIVYFVKKKLDQAGVMDMGRKLLGGKAECCLIIKPISKPNEFKRQIEVTQEARQGMCEVYEYVCILKP